VPVIGSTPYDLVSAITSRVRALWSDQDSQVFSDAAWGTGLNGDLYEYINQAYEKLALKLGNVGSGTLIEDDYQIVIPAGTFQLVYGGGPGLPADLIVPLRLWEKSTTGVDEFMEMAQYTVALPDTQPDSMLRFWRWVTDAIEFVSGGANQDRLLKIQYERRLSPLLHLTDYTEVMMAVGYLANMCCYYMGRGRQGMAPNPNMADYKAEAEDYLHELANTIVRAKPGSRRKAYGNRRRAIYF
jgi:hypothetical protein